MQRKVLSFVPSNNSSGILLPSAYSPFDTTVLGARTGDGRGEMGTETLRRQEEAAVTTFPALLAKKVDHSKVYFAVSAAVTAVSFLLDDVRVLALPKQSDPVIDGIYLVLVFFYCVDVAVQVAASSDYFASVYFWLDLWATLGTVGSVSLVYEREGKQCGNSEFRSVRVAINSARLSRLTITFLRHLNLTKAIAVQKKEQHTQWMRDTALTPASPVGRRTVRSSSSILSFPDIGTANGDSRKIDRKHTDTTTEKRTVPKRRGTLYRLWKDGAIGEKLRATKGQKEEEGLTESGVSKRMSRRLVGMLAVVGVLVGVFEWSCATAADSGGNGRFALRLVTSGLDTPRGEEFVEEYISRYRDFHSFTVLTHLNINGKLLWDDLDTDLRDSEKCVLTDGPARAEFSIRTKLQLFALFDICSVVLLCALFFYVTLDSSVQIRKMVLFPLERMMKTMQLIWIDPVTLSKSVPILRHRRTKKWCEQSTNIADEEVYVLENAFRKIGLMLGLVYGSAGREMITNAISLQGEFSPLVPGRKTLAIICFVKIRSFEEALDVLGPRILAYINLISRFVHSTSERYLGSINKNLGDSYLLVWKAPDEPQSGNQRPVLNTNSLVLRTGTSLALLFAVKTISKVTSSALLSSYRCLLPLDSQSAHHLAFGFHMGWAFEGPIGSPFKIDASYLSPNVNMAARIATAALQYDTSILLSRDVFIRVDDYIRPFLRHIDTVKLKGVFESVQLYSFDTASPDGQWTSQPPTKRETIRKRNRLKEALDEGLISIAEIVSKSETLAGIRRKYPKEFFDCYEAALQLYFKGRWKDADSILSSQCVALVPFDGPTRSLMEYMESLHFQPPENWSGVRELLSK